MTPLQQTISWLLMHRPYYGSLATQILTWQEKPDLPFPAATDGRSVMVNPATFDERPLPERGFIAAHEVEHCVREHCVELERIYGASGGVGPDGNPWDQKRINIAMDLLINEALMADGFECPPDARTAAKLNLSITDAMTWREVYLLLAQQGKGGSGKGNSGKGNSSNGNSGGGFDQHLPGASADDPAARQQVMRAVASAIEAARRAGKVPAHAKRLLDELADPPPSLKDMLIQFVSANGRGADWSYRRPRRSRLCMPPHLVLPTQCAPSAGCVVLGVDVSGSIRQEELSYFAGCIISTLAECAFEELWVVTIESDITGAQQIQSLDDLERFFSDVKGGGGTHMPELYRWIEKEGIRPTQVIFLTDGYTDFGTPPPYPVGWCMTTDMKAPYGTHMRIRP